MGLMAAIATSNCVMGALRWVLMMVDKSYGARCVERFVGLDLDVRFMTDVVLMRIWFRLLRIYNLILTI